MTNRWNSPNSIFFEKYLKVYSSVWNNCSEEIIFSAFLWSTIWCYAYHLISCNVLCTKLSVEMAINDVPLNGCNFFFDFQRILSTLLHAILDCICTIGINPFLHTLCVLVFFFVFIACMCTFGLYTQTKCTCIFIYFRSFFFPKQDQSKSRYNASCSLFISGMKRMWSFFGVLCHLSFFFDKCTKWNRTPMNNSHVLCNESLNKLLEMHTGWTEYITNGTYISNIFYRFREFIWYSVYDVRVFPFRF